MANMTTTDTNTTHTYTVRYRSCGEWHEVAGLGYDAAGDEVDRLIETGGADTIEVPEMFIRYTLTANALNIQHL